MHVCDAFYDKGLRVAFSHLINDKGLCVCTALSPIDMSAFNQALCHTEGSIDPESPVKEPAVGPGESATPAVFPNSAPDSTTLELWAEVGSSEFARRRLELSFGIAGIIDTHSDRALGGHETHSDCDIGGDLDSRDRDPDSLIADAFALVPADADAFALFPVDALQPVPEALHPYRRQQRGAARRQRAQPGHDIPTGWRMRLVSSHAPVIARPSRARVTAGKIITWDWTSNTRVEEHEHRWTRKRCRDGVEVSLLTTRTRAIQVPEGMSLTEEPRPTWRP